MERGDKTNHAKDKKLFNKEYNLKLSPPGKKLDNVGPNTIFKKRNYLLKIYIMLYIIYINPLIKVTSKENIKQEIFYKFSYITLKINLTGIYNIYHDGSNYYTTSTCNSNKYVQKPDEIYINEINQSTIKSSYNFTESENYIKLVWKKNIKTTKCLFYRCSKINEINFTNFDLSEVTDMSYMFESCSSLISIDLSNFDASQVTNMAYIFHTCSSLISLDLSNFNSSQVTNIEGMFQSCSSLISINLSNFNTSQVTNMRYMFRDCKKLDYLNLSNFDTSQITNMEGMFQRCSSLISIDLSNFDASQVTNMAYIFDACSSLISLDLSNFNTSQVTNMGDMFRDCKTLNYLDLSYFDTSKVINMACLFCSCSSLSSLDLSYFNTIQVKDISIMFFECKSLVSLNLSNFDTSQVTTMSQLFQGCEKLKSLNLSNFNTSNVKSMKYMFRDCTNLTVLNLASFNTQNVITMQYMFYNCILLSSLDLSNFDTSKVTDMNYMFADCNSLKFLNITNFDTSNVKNMKYIFSNCKSLTSLDLPKFKTQKIEEVTKDLSYMFNQCNLLSSLDLSNFINSKINNMAYMFHNCSMLTSLNLSHFDTSEVTDLSFMFSNCSNLGLVDFTNFNTTNVKQINSMFFGCQSLSSLDLSSFNTSHVTNMSSLFYDCMNLSLLNISSFSIEVVKNLDYIFYNCKSLVSLDLPNFGNSQILSYTIKSMFHYCESLEFINLENYHIVYIYGYSNYFFYKNSKNLILCTQDYKLIRDLNGYNITINCYKKENNEFSKNSCYKSSSTEIYNKYACKICGNNYYQIYNDIKKNNSYIICYEVIDGYYLNHSIFKPCFSTCKTCDKEGNETYNNCLQCRDDYKQVTIIGNYSNCLNQSSNDLINISDSIKNIDIDLTNEYNNLNESNVTNVTNLINANEINNTNTETLTNLNLISSNSNYLIQQFTESNTKYQQIINTKEVTNEEMDSKVKIETNNISQIISQVIQEFTKFDIVNGKDTKFEFGNFLISMTKIENQKNSQNSNQTFIDLKECENELKSFYNISHNNSLYILKIEKREEGMKIPKVEYEVYYPLYERNLTKLNLTVCKNMKIDIFIPVKINDTLDVYNSSSDYYNNICSKTTSELGTDISLLDRQKEFVNKNMTLCEEDCNLIEYNYTTEKAKCSCLVKIKLPFIEDIKFDKNKLYKSFTDINNFANIKFLKCYKQVFNGKSLQKNYGFFIYIFIFVVYFILMFLFYFKYYSILINLIKKIVDAKTNIYKSIKNKINTTNNPLEQSTERIRKPRRKKNKGRNLLNKNNNNNIKNNKSEMLNVENEDIKEYKQLLKHTDSEINSLEYPKALKFDKRACFQYYLSLLKSGNLLIFSFYSVDYDYNSKIIKIFLFFFSFGVQLTINALFFNDNTMHKIYVDEGSFNFIYQIPTIIYSSLISYILDAIIKYLSLTESDILEIKHEKKLKKMESKYEKLIAFIKIKFILFYIVSFCLLLTFGYYNTCFCCIYENTQSHLIKDTLISFGLSFIYPFGIYLIPSFIRSVSLHAEKQDKECLYKISQLLQNL